MTESILLLIKGLLPEVLDFVKKFKSTNGRLPTVEELEIELESNLDKYITIGEDWLKEHPQHE